MLQLFNYHSHFQSINPQMILNFVETIKGQALCSVLLQSEIDSVWNPILA
jgi:hypothetical protein